MHKLVSTQYWTIAEKMGETTIILISYIMLLSVTFTTCGRNRHGQQSGHSSAGQSSHSSEQGSGQGPQPCGFLKRVECPELANLTDGTVVYSGRGFEDSANYSCNTGFELVGFPTRTCLSDESWSGAMPTCVFAGCGYESLSAPDNGQIVYSGHMIDDTANVTCDRGYTLTGVGFWSCLVTGWEGTDGQCDPVTCPALTNPTGGSVTAPAAPVFEDEAVYSCNPGYELSGYNRRCCLSDGEWSGEAPTCVPSVQCPELSVPDNGTVNVFGLQDPGTTAQYSCDYGLISGSLVRYCLINGTWSGTDPECVTDPGIGIIICEGNRETISCSGPGEVIDIKYANYGRTSTNTTICPHARISNTDCGTDDELDQDKVIDLCQWQTSCELFASNSVFGDPCQGTYKYLEVTYWCVND